MHPHAEVIQRLYTAIANADPDAIMACYVDDAVDDAYFEDIAFRRRGRKEIHQMWRLVCHAQPKVKILSTAAYDQKGSGSWEACYMFGRTKTDPGRQVINPTTSTFTFRDRRVVEHRDDCDARAWARQAFTFPKSLVAGNVGWVRRRSAAKKLDKFLEEHPG